MTRSRWTAPSSTASEGSQQLSWIFQILCYNIGSLHFFFVFSPYLLLSFLKSILGSPNTPFFFSCLTASNSAFMQGALVVYVFNITLKYLHFEVRTPLFFFTLVCINFVVRYLGISSIPSLSLYRLYLKWSVLYLCHNSLSLGEMQPMIAHSLDNQLQQGTIRDRKGKEEKREPKTK